MQINQRTIGLNLATYIIAELGTNYNGDVDVAIEMVERCKNAGADAVKLQIISADNSYTRTSESYEIFKAIELGKEQWLRVVQYAADLGIDIFPTFVNAQDIQEYADVEFPVLKVSSTNITNFPLLKSLARQGRPIILSTGAAYLKEVEEAVTYLRQLGQTDIGILQCTALYPTEDQEINLNVIDQLVRTFPDCPIGFSDHSRDLVAPLAAVAKGASLVEMHVTLDPNMSGPDHYFSKTFDDLQLFVQSARRIESMRGDHIKQPVEREQVARQKWQRSLVALKPIQAGEILTEAHVTAKRSNERGLEPKQLDLIVGKRAVRNLERDDPITKEVVHI